MEGRIIETVNVGLLGFFLIKFDDIFIKLFLVSFLQFGVEFFKRLGHSLADCRASVICYFKNSAIGGSLRSRKC